MDKEGGEAEVPSNGLAPASMIDDTGRQPVLVATVRMAQASTVGPRLGQTKGTVALQVGLRTEDQIARNVINHGRASRQRSQLHQMGSIYVFYADRGLKSRKHTHMPP